MNRARRKQIWQELFSKSRKLDGYAIPFDCKRRWWETDYFLRKRLSKVIRSFMENRGAREYLWDIQFVYNPWASFGIHIDHVNFRIDLHLPLVNIFAGNMMYREGARLSNFGLRKIFHDRIIQTGILI